MCLCVNVWLVPTEVKAGPEGDDECGELTFGFFRSTAGVTAYQEEEEGKSWKYWREETSWLMRT
jgi:hypothetical protein